MYIYVLITPVVIKWNDYIFVSSESADAFIVVFVVVVVVALCTKTLVCVSSICHRAACNHMTRKNKHRHYII